MTLSPTLDTTRFAGAAAYMDALPAVDWSDLETAAETTRQIAQGMADRPDLVRALVDRVPHVPELRAKCEIHTMDDKVVIWDAPEKGLRIRLRLANDSQYERVHNHRFSFTAYLLYGSYFHTIFATDQRLDENADVGRFWVRSVRTEVQGDCITLHHEQLHTTFTSPETVSLMIQSPAQKEKAFIIRTADGEVWWRVGEAAETPERRLEVTMSDERFEHWSTRLRELGVC